MAFGCWIKTKFKKFPQTNVKSPSSAHNVSYFKSTHSISIKKSFNSQLLHPVLQTFSFPFFVHLHAITKINMTFLCAKFIFFLNSKKTKECTNSLQKIKSIQFTNNSSFFLTFNQYEKVFFFFGVFLSNICAHCEHAHDVWKLFKIMNANEIEQNSVMCEGWMEWELGA